MAKLSTRDQPDWWKNIGGQNSQDSTLERRSLLWNDGETVAPNAPPGVYDFEFYKGKFFPRGCRGKIETLYIYSIRTGAANIQLWLSPFPGHGPIIEATLTPGLTWGWWPVTIERMWNYDSLFIWILNCTPLASWGYDAVQPYDGHESANPYPPFAEMDIRPYFRLLYSAETPGDVPVSGIVNTIEIPNVATRLTYQNNLAVAHNVITYCNVEFGGGSLLEARVIFDTSVPPTAGAIPAAVLYEVIIGADNVNTVRSSNRELTQSAVATAGRNSVGEFYQITVADPEYDTTVLTCRIPVKFQQSLFLGIYQSTGAPVNIDARIWANILR